MLQRIHYIDRLKGLAILLVIMGHYECYILDKFGVLFEIIGSCHMPLFMFLSGYVLSRSYTIKETGINMLKLLSPFCIIGLLYTLYIKSDVYGFLSSPFKYGYWYLYVLAIFRAVLYMCQFILRHVVGNRDSRMVLRVEILFLIILFGVIQILNTYVSQPYNDMFSLWVVRQYYLFFCLGYLSRRYDILGRLSKHNLVYSLCLVSFVPVCYLYIHGYGHFFYVCSPLLIGWLSHIFIQRENQTSKIENVLELLGCHSLDIYVYHYFILTILNLSMLGKWFESSGNLFIETVFGILLSVLIAFVAILIGKLIRLSNLLKRLLFL